MRLAVQDIGKSTNLMRVISALLNVSFTLYFELKKNIQKKLSTHVFTYFMFGWSTEEEVNKKSCSSFDWWFQQIRGTTMQKVTMIASNGYYYLYLFVSWGPSTWSALGQLRLPQRGSLDRETDRESSKRRPEWSDGVAQWNQGNWHHQ